MPKVLRIINRFNLGGPTYNAAYLSKYMAPEFETLLVGGMHDSTEKSSEYILDELGLEPLIIPEMKREINFKNDLIAYKKIKKIIQDFKPDIVHTHASKAGALGRLAAHKMGVKVIIHTFHGHVFHSYFGKLKTEFYKFIERKLAKRSSKIIAISKLQKQELVEKYKICSEEQTVVIPLGFDLSRFQTNQEEKRKIFRNEWNINKDEIAIGIIGRLVPIKDHHFFIDVIQEIVKYNHTNIRFFIIGDGEYKENIINYVKTKNLPFTFQKGDRSLITFTSWIKNIDIANAGLDIICLCSKNEGTPVSLIEAQSSLKPIISTKVGGINNIVIENKSALLSEPGNLESFVNNLVLLINDPNLRQELSISGNHIFDKYNMNRLVDDMTKFYYKLL